MPLSAYKSFFAIVKTLVNITEINSSRLKSIEKEIRVLSKIKSKVSRKKTKRKTKKRNGKASRAMKIHQREGISLKEAWKRVK